MGASLLSVRSAVGAAAVVDSYGHTRHVSRRCQPNARYSASGAQTLSVTAVCRACYARPMPARYKMLDSGLWGVVLTYRPTPGEAVTVTRKDGTTTTETVAGVMWEDRRTGEVGCSIVQTRRQVHRPQVSAWDPAPKRRR